MAEVTVDDPAYEGHTLTFPSRLFAPYSFFVTQDVPRRNQIKAVIRKGGGRLVSHPTNTTPIDYWLIPDYFEGNTRPEAKRFSIVLDGARQGQFPPTAIGEGRDYYSPFVRRRNARNAFTEAEVSFLTGFVNINVGKPPLGQADMEYLCRLMNYRHTEESIRSKLKRMEKFPVSLSRTRPLTFQPPIHGNDPVEASGAPEEPTPIPNTRFPDVLPSSVVPASRRTPSETVMATPVQTRPLAMSTQIPDTTIEVPDTPVASNAEKSKGGNTQVPDTPQTRKESPKKAEKPSQSSSQQSSTSSQSSSSQVPDTPAKAPASTQKPAIGLHKNPSITEVPATPAGSNKASTSKKSSDSATGSQESSDAEPLVMRHSPRKSRTNKPSLYTQVPFTQVENSSSPSSTRFTSSQMIPDSQQDMSSTPLRFPVQDPGDITDSQALSARLPAPPGASQMTVDESGSSLDRAMAVARQDSESGAESSWSRDSSASYDSASLSSGPYTRVGRRTRASRAAARRVPPPAPLQVGHCVLSPRLFATKRVHTHLKGVIYGIEKVRPQQTAVQETRQIQMTQVDTRQVEVVSRESITVTSSQSSSSFAEDSHVIEIDSDSEEDERIIQVPDTQENELLRDAQKSHDSLDDVSSVPDSQASLAQGPNVFTQFPTTSERRYVDASMDMDVSVASLPSLDSVKATLKSFSSRIANESDYEGDVLGSAAEKRFEQSSLSKRVALLVLDNEGEVVEESFIGEDDKGKEVEEHSEKRKEVDEERNEDVEMEVGRGSVEEDEDMEEDEYVQGDMEDVEFVEESTETTREYPSEIYDDAQRRPTTAQLDDSLERWELRRRERHGPIDVPSTPARVQTVPSRITFSPANRMRSVVRTDKLKGDLSISSPPQSHYPQQNRIPRVPIRCRRSKWTPDMDADNFPYEQVSFDDIKDDLDYGLDNSDKGPMVGSEGLRSLKEISMLILREDVEGFLLSIQGHNADISEAFVISLLMSRQVTEHTTIEEIQDMELRYPRHPRFFSPKDDEAIVNFMNDEDDTAMEFVKLKLRHHAEDIAERGEYLDAVSEALDAEQSLAVEEEQRAAASSSSNGRADRNAQHVKQEMFDFDIPRDINVNKLAQSVEANVTYDVPSSPGYVEPSVDDRKRAMEEKLKKMREKRKTITQKRKKSYEKRRESFNSTVALKSGDESSFRAQSETPKKRTWDVIDLEVGQTDKKRRRELKKRRVSEEFFPFVSGYKGDDLIVQKTPKRKLSPSKKSETPQSVPTKEATPKTEATPKATTPKETPKRPPGRPRVERSGRRGRPRKSGSIPATPASGAEAPATAPAKAPAKKVKRPRRF